MIAKERVKSGNAMLATSRPLASYLFGGNMVAKKCSKCAVVKTVDKFRARTQRPSGLQSQCKLCEAEYFKLNSHRGVARSRKYRATHPDKCAAAVKAYSARWPERAAAREAVRAAVRYRRLIPQPCFMCGAKGLAHHASYAPEMRLFVTWLCSKHHKQLHIEAVAQ